MIFKSISFTNIGPYRGINTFEFPTKKDANMILIGGKNGAGKTTFLTGVRLALYGPLAYGYKTETKEYYRKVLSFLNNRALKIDENNFRVIIDFEIVENFQRIDCAIHRHWKVQNEKVRETVYVMKAGHYLSEAEKDVFFNSLRSDFPPSLLELCLFDGEEIAKIINNDRISDYLNELSLKIFNLDLFDNLESDLSSYISQTMSSEQAIALENDQQNLKSNLIEKQEEISGTMEIFTEQKDELENITNELERLKKEFKIHGGLVHEERKQLTEEISSIEISRKHTNDRIKDFIAKDLPFFLTRSLMSEAVDQLNAEEDYHISSALEKKIMNLKMDKLLSETNYVSTDGESIKKFLLKELVSTTEVKLIHHASNTEAQQVKTFAAQLNDQRLQMFTSQLDLYKSSLGEIQGLKQQLKLNEKTNEFETMISSIEKLTNEKQEAEKRVTVLEIELDKLNAELQQLDAQREKVAAKLYDLRKNKSSFIQSSKIMAVSKKFKELQLRNKIKDVEYFASKMFKDLMRKKAFINHIKIDSKTFSIQVIDSNNDILNKDILSAGEKELLILSIIWGVFTSSNRELPFIFDTLLGRLDLEHKEAIVMRLIPKFGKQVIVLSTDSEIDNSLHKKAHEFVALEYTLNFDPIEKQTTIESGFFKNLSPEVE